jgi:hypothetical protein
MLMHGPSNYASAVQCNDDLFIGYNATEFFAAEIQLYRFEEERGQSKDVEE